MKEIICINSPDIISTTLTLRLREIGKVQAEIAVDTGLSQSQISRIVTGKFKLCSKNVLNLCKYAEIKIVESDLEEKWSDKLTNALNFAWDGTEEHAKAINKILRAIGSIRRKEN
jgi:transcriptional regulator with XRE-family HTH domain